MSRFDTVFQDLAHQAVPLFIDFTNLSAADPYLEGAVRVRNGSQ